MKSQAPNILFLLPDQLRHDFLGCYGADYLQTPSIDSLAAAGKRFEVVISPCPICVPARASLLTGQSAHANGVTHNLAWLRPDRQLMGIQSWPERLSQAGYKTAAIGKMHFYPWDSSEGFQDRIIAEDKRHLAIKDDYHYALRAAGYKKEHARTQEGYTAQKGASINSLPDPLHVDRWVANQTIEYLQKLSADQPFALMVGFPGPHCPYDPPKDALERIDPNKIPSAIPDTAESQAHHDTFVASYKNDWAALDYSSLTNEESRVIRHHYAALVERLDADIGRILDALTDEQRDNTVVVFASDHGDYLGDFARVGKTTFHEPSIRVPLIMTDFRNPVASVQRAPVSLLDIYPTLMQLAGLDIPEHAEGKPLGDEEEQRVIVGVTTQGIMTRDSRWKLVRYSNGVEALFDLLNDPQEQANVIDSQATERIRLDLELTRSLLDGMAMANADKAVPQAKADPTQAFFNRQWVRPYPSRL